MSSVVQSADMQFARLKELFWATVFGSGEDQLSALLAELKSWGVDLESIISSRAAVAEQAQAGSSPVQQQEQQQRTSMQSAEHGAEAAPCCGDLVVRAISHEAFQGQAAEPEWDLAFAPARKQQHNISRDTAASALPQDGARQEPVQGGAQSKPCKCKKSRCLKLYCDCFATGHFCSEACVCVDCQNRTGSAPVVLTARAFVLARDPSAFRPKVVGSAAHVKGCHCRKSRCLKKYCECYLGNVPCTEACRCTRCLNREPRANREAGSAEEAGLGMPLEADMDAEGEAPGAPPRKQQRLDQDLFLADPAVDSSASLEGASAKCAAGGLPGVSGTFSGEGSLRESALTGTQLQSHALGRAAAARAQAPLLVTDWAAGQSAGATGANLEDPAMADDATSPPPCLPRHGRLSRSAAGGARAPTDPQRSINPAVAVAWRTFPAGEPATQEAAAQLQMSKRRRLGMRIRSGNTLQLSPERQLACAALPKRMDLMPAAWRPALTEVHGNTPGLPVVPGRQEEAL